MFVCPLVTWPETKIEGRQGVVIVRKQLTRYVTGTPFSPEQPHFLDFAATERTFVSRFRNETNCRFDLVTLVKDLLLCNAF